MHSYSFDQHRPIPPVRSIRARAKPMGMVRFILNLLSVQRKGQPMRDCPLSAHTVPKRVAADRMQNAPAYRNRRTSSWSASHCGGSAWQVSPFTGVWFTDNVCHSGAAVKYTVVIRINRFSQYPHASRQSGAAPVPCPAPHAAWPGQNAGTGLRSLRR